MSDDLYQIDWPTDICPVSTVQLRHTLADGCWHIDWMIATDRRHEAGLLTFRLAHPLGYLDQKPAHDVTLTAERITNHRPQYLTFEGEVSDNRGQVERIASGVIGSIETERGTSVMTVQWDGDDELMVLKIQPLNDQPGKFRITLAK